jgi:hypothetical protein
MWIGVKRPLAVVIVVDWYSYFRRSYDRTNLPRVFAKWITWTTRAEVHKPCTGHSVRWCVLLCRARDGTARHVAAEGWGGASAIGGEGELTLSERDRWSACHGMVGGAGSTQLVRTLAQCTTRVKDRGCSYDYTDCYVLSAWRRPSSCTRLVMQLLNDTFLNRWIGRGSTINWPPRSPGLTPLDFCLWGWKNSKVYRRKVNTYMGRSAWSHLERQDELRRATRHVLTQVAKCFDVDGGIFENVV